MLDGGKGNDILVGGTGRDIYVEGTNAAIRRGGELGGPGAVVVKRPKRGQDRRLDLPAVGLETVRAMAEVKASCLACEAGQTLFFDRIGALALADEHSMAIVGRI